MTTNSNAGSSPVDRRVRPLIPRGEPWVRHGQGLDEWWGLLGYTCTKNRITGEWVLKYRGEELGRYDFLSVAMRVPEEGPNAKVSGGGTPSAGLPGSAAKEE